MAGTENDNTPAENGKMPQEEPSDAQQTDQEDRVIRLPLSRVKTIIKMDPDVSLASQEAVVAIAKAAELFISTVAKDASIKTLNAKRKTLLKKDLDNIWDTRDCFAFLEGAID